MKRQSSKSSSKSSSKKPKFKFDRKDNTFFESTVTTEKGTTNKLKFIFDKNAPEIQQRITE